MRLIVMGYGRHGKDTVCEILQKYHGLKFIGSSQAACEVAVYPVLGTKYGYLSAQECFDDRANHRKEWFDLISDYNKGDPCRLSRYIFDKASIYCGIRSRREFYAARATSLFDFSIWVDASERIPPEDSNSNELLATDADFVLDNNKDLNSLKAGIESLLATLHDLNGGRHGINLR